MMQEKSDTTGHRKFEPGWHGMGDTSDIPKSCPVRWQVVMVGLFIFVATHAHCGELLNADFENLKSRLVGTWSFTENGQSYDATFEAVSHGHAILERNSGLIAVYHPDGVHSLLMTLYTRDGNQPRFRARGFRENPASITFVFQDISNWKKGTEHINGLELFFKDRDHLIEKWETLNPNGTKANFEFKLTRKGSAQGTPCRLAQKTEP